MSILAIYEFALTFASRKPSVYVRRTTRFWGPEAPIGIGYISGRAYFRPISASTYDVNATILRLRTQLPKPHLALRHDGLLRVNPDMIWCPGNAGPGDGRPNRSGLERRIQRTSYPEGSMLHGGTETSSCTQKDRPDCPIALQTSQYTGPLRC